jgi:hypothetical protein
MEEATQHVPMVVLAVAQQVQTHIRATPQPERKPLNLNHLCFQVLGVRNLDLMEALREQPGIQVVVVVLVETAGIPRLLVALGGRMQFWEQLIFGQVAVVVRVTRALREMVAPVVVAVVVQGNTPQLLLEQVARV